MISGLDLNETKDYVLPSDKENPTVWKLGAISSYLFARMSAESANREIEMAYRVLQLGLKGWDNFSVPYETKKENIYGREIEVVPISVLERIPLTVASELSTKILEINEISEDERKN